MARFGLGSVLGASAVGAYGMQQLHDHGASGVWGMMKNWGDGPAKGGSSEVREEEIESEQRGQKQRAGS